MLQVTCLEKVKDKDRIIGYILEDEAHNQKFVTSEQLKNAVVSNQVIITNLKLTSDGRLVNIKDKDWHGDHYTKNGFPNINRELSSNVGENIRLAQAERLNATLQSLNNDEMHFTKTDEELDAEYLEFTKRQDEISKDTFNELMQQSGLSKKQLIKLYDTMEGDTREEKINNLSKYLVKAADDRVTAEKQRINDKLDRIEKLHNELMNDARKNVDKAALKKLKKSNGIKGLFDAFKC